MARLLTAGAETASATTDGFTVTDTEGTGVIIDTSTVRTGARSWKFDGGSIGAQPHLTFPFTGVTARTYYARIYVNLSGLSGQVVDLLWFERGGLRMASASHQSSNHTIGLYEGGGGTTLTPTVNVSGTAWIMVELACRINTSTNDDYAELRVNGTSIASSTTLNLGTTGLDGCAFGAGTSNASAIIYFDDMALNDDQGSAQNSWPDEGKIVLLTPISDNAVGTGWTLGTGTAIASNSGSTAVKNTPPVGVADLTAGSDTKQIRNATANANVNYDANLTTYTTAGIKTYDNINVLLPIVVTAAPVTTSAKAGTVGVSSNPVITNVSLGAGGTAGAFWSGTAAGTYATGWKISYGTTTYSPSLTLGSSPVMRITQVTSSTRIAMVCFMGMYVDYTPGPVYPYLNMPRRAA